MDHSDAAGLSRTINGIVGQRWPVLNQALAIDVRNMSEYGPGADDSREDSADEARPELHSTSNDTKLKRPSQAGTEVEEVATERGITLQHYASPKASTDGNTVVKSPLQAGPNTEDFPAQSTSELEQILNQGLANASNPAEVWNFFDRAAEYEGSTEVDHPWQADAGTSTENFPEKIIIGPDQTALQDHPNTNDSTKIWRSLDQILGYEGPTEEEHSLQVDVDDEKSADELDSALHQPDQRRHTYDQNANKARPVPLEAAEYGNYQGFENLVRASADAGRVEREIYGAPQQPAWQVHTNILKTVGAMPLTHQLPYCGGTIGVEHPLQPGPGFEDIANEDHPDLHQVASQGSPIAYNTEEGWPFLHQATWYGNYTEVEHQLFGGANVEEVDDEGETALHHAAWQGYANLASLLLDYGADPSARNRKLQTPLHYAASNGFTTLVRLLLHKGADPKVIDYQGRKPCSLAQNHSHPSVAEILCQMDPDLHSQELVPQSDDTSTTSPQIASLMPIVRCTFPVDRFPLVWIEHHGQAKVFTCFKVSVGFGSDEIRSYILKTRDGHDFVHEFESLSAIHKVTTSFCPRPLAHGKITESVEGYLLREFIHETIPDDTQVFRSVRSSFAQKLALLHLPRRKPDSVYRPDMEIFGFHVPTYVGGALYPGGAKRSYCTRTWSKYFVDFRLCPIWQAAKRKQIPHISQQRLYRWVINTVVPRLLRPGHLGGEHGIEPALVHGELWAENKIHGSTGRGRHAGDMVFNPASFYAHSEYELAAMRMFGEYSSGFFKEYHRLVPKTQPVEEYEARQTLYQV